MPKYYYIPRNTYLGVPYRRDGDFDYYNAAPKDVPTKEGQHWHSRNPYSGRLLKSRDHDTYDLMMKDEKKVGAELYTDPYGAEYTFFPGEMPDLLQPFMQKQGFPLLSRKPQGSFQQITFMDPLELEMRQAYIESNFNPNSQNVKSGALGLFQIMPSIVKDYLKENPEKTGDLKDPEYNKQIRDWMMQKLYDSPTINTNNPSEEVRLAKTLAAYNWGRKNLENYLVNLKSQGKDIYSDNTWMEGIPEETRNYINFILFKKPSGAKNNNEYTKTNYMYKNLF